jgi:hypothetical protein
MIPKFVGVTGLPRAGSTLLCQLLAQHPEIHCEGHSSPLCNTLLGIRRMVSDDTFFLLVFPSYLHHSVDANASRESRVSVSFNLMFSAFTAALSKPMWGDE